MNADDDYLDIGFTMLELQNLLRDLAEFMDDWPSSDEFWDDKEEALRDRLKKMENDLLEVQSQL